MTAKGYIGSDGIHPTDLGHRVIADLLRSAGYAPPRYAALAMVVAARFHLGSGK